MTTQSHTLTHTHMSCNILIRTGIKEAKCRKKGIATKDLITKGLILKDLKTKEIIIQNTRKQKT